VMASSVNRRIEGYLSRVMGQRDPAGLIRPRPTEPIRACGLVLRQTGQTHDRDWSSMQTREKILASRGPSTHAEQPVEANRPDRAEHRGGVAVRQRAADADAVCAQREGSDLAGCPSHKRGAIYTRKSFEEGLEQEFNSRNSRGETASLAERDRFELSVPLSRMHRGFLTQLRRFDPPFRDFRRASH
jgi:hypothetical protein